MTDATDAVNFISSCYIAVESCAPFVYSTYEWSADESVDPPTWEGNNQKTAWNLWSPTNAAGYWDAYYNYNGHCHMFLNILAENNPRGATESDKARWKSEAEFSKSILSLAVVSNVWPYSYCRSASSSIYNAGRYARPLTL